jgi:hypothetical protein
VTAADASAVKDRRISFDLEVEILTCADTGVPELVVDDQVVTADEARAKLAEAVEALSLMRELVGKYEVRES